MTDGRRPQTIDQVIERLGEILEICRREESPLGYFPALYRRVTVRVKGAIEAGEFEDGERMERLDLVFASRYLDAWDGFRSDGPISEAWSYAFRVGSQWWPIVLQHLLLGINAHINLDLGIATAETAGAPGALRQLESDFNRINRILAVLVGEVKSELASIWTTLRLFNRYLGSVEDAIINFSLDKARAAAWRAAEDFAALPRPEWPRVIARCDRTVVQLAQAIRYPGFTGTAVNYLVRCGELGSVARKIDVLS